MHAGADPATRAQIELVFQASTLYGGGIGELLGVALCMALAVMLLGIGALHAASLPRPSAWRGIVAATLLLAVGASWMRQG